VQTLRFVSLKGKLDQCACVWSETKKETIIPLAVTTASKPENVFIKGYQLHKLLPELSHGDGARRGWCIILFRLFKVWFFG